MAPALKQVMRKIMEQLLALQNLQLNGRRRNLAVLADIEQLRAEVPPPVLAHFERLTARGKKGVATVRDGVCTECHLRVTTGKLANLSAGNDIYLCDNCGRYLHLPDADKIGMNAISSEPFPPVKRLARKMAHQVA